MTQHFLTVKRGSAPFCWLLLFISLVATASCGRGTADNGAAPKAVAVKTPAQTIDEQRRARNRVVVTSQAHEDKAGKLQDAADKGDVAQIKALLGQGVTVDSRDANGATALHHAAQAGNLEVVELLVDNGAAINAPTKHGTTPLHHAAKAGDLKVYEFLLANGADISAPDVGGHLPIFYAESEHQKAAVDLLREHGSYGGYMQFVIANNRREVKNGNDSVPFFIPSFSANGSGTSGIGSGIDDEVLDLTGIGGMPHWLGMQTGEKGRTQAVFKVVVGSKYGVDKTGLVTRLDQGSSHAPAGGSYLSLVVLGSDGKAMDAHSIQLTVKTAAGDALKSTTDNAGSVIVEAVPSRSTIQVEIRSDKGSMYKEALYSFVRGASPSVVVCELQDVRW